MTNWGRVLLVCLLLLVSASAAWPNGDFGQERAIMDSLSRVHPRFRGSWLAERGIRDEYWQESVPGGPRDLGI